MIGKPNLVEDSGTAQCFCNSAFAVMCHQNCKVPLRLWCSFCTWVTRSSQEINYLKCAEKFFSGRIRSPDLSQPARREREHSANRAILSGRKCEHLLWITTSHYLNMTHPRCYSTSKGPLQLMWRPGNRKTTGKIFLTLTVVKWISQWGKTHDDWKCFHLS